jgi:hypothetical protein
MKKTIFFIACVGVLASCGSKKGSENSADTDSTKTTLQYFGDTITEENAMPGKDLMAFMADKDSAEVKFTATIAEVCQKKGCWMDVDLGGGKLLTVRFKDYGFFMPKDAAGRTTIMDGYCYKTIETVDWLKHKAKDANKSQAAIDSITQPDTTYAFTANGVIIK